MTLQCHVIGRSEEGNRRVALAEQHGSALPVPFAIEITDRVRKERYYDVDFFQLEADMLCPNPKPQTPWSFLLKVSFKKFFVRQVN